MFTYKMETKQELGETVHNNVQYYTKVFEEKLKQEEDRINKKKQVQKQVTSNNGSLYIKRLGPTNALNAPLTHHLYNQFES